MISDSVQRSRKLASPIDVYTFGEMAVSRETRQDISEPWRRTVVAKADAAKFPTQALLEPQQDPIVLSDRFPRTRRTFGHDLGQRALPGRNIPLHVGPEFDPTALNRNVGFENSPGGESIAVTDQEGRSVSARRRGPDFIAKHCQADRAEQGSIESLSGAWL